jgi:Na+/melibiose symporter-like transporter
MAAPAEAACPPDDAAADVKPAAPHAVPDALSANERRNLALLSAAWACSFSILAASVAALSVAAKAVSPSRKLDTVPVALILFATAVWNVPVAVALSRFGRTRTFVACALIGAGGGAIAAGSIARRSFGGLCAAALALAVGNAAVHAPYSLSRPTCAC